uniref:Uncharacterized protein n=1 Tax=Setaria viridis TaxID=4556 RepID=A0A4V6D7U6_SETVI|nr:LOW QUALITY PROTEIN: hypothetical protein SEVIR_7G247200v2 [Setaria viridis]
MAPLPPAAAAPAAARLRAGRRRSGPPPLLPPARCHSRPPPPLLPARRPPASAPCARLRPPARCYQPARAPPRPAPPGPLAPRRCPLLLAPRARSWVIIRAAPSPPARNSSAGLLLLFSAAQLHLRSACLASTARRFLCRGPRARAGPPAPAAARPRLAAHQRRAGPRRRAGPPPAFSFLRPDSRNRRAAVSARDSLIRSESSGGFKPGALSLSPYKSRHLLPVSSAKTPAPQHPKP